MRVSIIFVNKLTDNTASFEIERCRFLLGTIAAPLLSKKGGYSCAAHFISAAAGS